MILLLGRGGEKLLEKLVRDEPRLAGRISASGSLEARALSLHLQACDLLLQPYPDGVSCRRTSFMAGLAHGRAIVTTSGAATEPFWAQNGAAATVPISDPDGLVDVTARLLADAERRRCLGEVAERLYQERFTVEKTVNSLREATS
jgi:glycosyltransferase involved in cell wall biosynthesis